VIRSIRQ
jgi:hypothetical protein